MDWFIEYFENIDKELSAIKEVKGEEIQRARAKDKSNQNW